MHGAKYCREVQTSAYGASTLQSYRQTADDISRTYVGLVTFGYKTALDCTVETNWTDRKREPSATAEQSYLLRLRTLRQSTCHNNGRKHSYTTLLGCISKREALLSQRDRAMLRVCIASIQNVERSLLLLVISASDIPLVVVSGMQLTIA